MISKQPPIKYSPGLHPETGEKGYILDEDYRYYSEEYDEHISLKKGMWSDGATGFVDLGANGILPRVFAWIRNRLHKMLGNVKSGWFFTHDKICNSGKWDSGKLITNWVASTVAGNILISDGWPILSPFVWTATFLFGGGEARKNGMFRIKKKKSDEKEK